MDWNGLMQGRVLPPIFFNISTNYQPTLYNTKTIAYADDLAITVKGKRFEDIGGELETVLNIISTYYKKETQPYQNSSKCIPPEFEKGKPQV